MLQQQLLVPTVFDAAHTAIQHSSSLPAQEAFGAPRTGTRCHADKPL